MQQRTFWQYMKDNFMVFPPIIFAIFMSIVSFKNHIPFMGGFMIFVVIFALVNSYIDWKKRG
jgi:hypothetical protein